MDSDVEDVLELGLQGDDIEGMDLDEPIQPLTLRVSGEASAQDPASSNPKTERKEAGRQRSLKFRGFGVSLSLFETPRKVTS